MKRAGAAFVLLLLLAAAFRAGRRSIRPEVETVETVRIDTVFRDRPLPVAVASRPVVVNVPRLVFVRADSAAPVRGAAGTPAHVDSVAVEVAVETRTYRDSLMMAQVSGPVVGKLRPTLEWYEVYPRTHTVTNTVHKPRRFAVTAGAGVSWTPEGIQPSVGVQFGVILWGW